MQKKKLKDLYKKIKDCHTCKYMNPKKALRQVDAVNLKSDVFIISQALAEKTLRRSGVNFLDENGKLGNTGKSLEKFLNKFGRTVYPAKKIYLTNGSEISPNKYGYTSVYNTDIIQCYPGKNKKGDRKPTDYEIAQCYNKGFLIKEIELVKPKLLLLMGRVSRDSFYKFYMKEQPPKSLTRHISNIIAKGRLPIWTPNNKKYNAYIIPIQHASGANPKFSKMIKNEKLIKLIKKVLR